MYKTISKLFIVFLTIIMLVFSSGIHLYEHYCLVGNETEIVFSEDEIKCNHHTDLHHHQCLCDHFDSHSGMLNHHHCYSDEAFEKFNHIDDVINSHNDDTFTPVSCVTSNVYLVLCQYFTSNFDFHFFVHFIRNIFPLGDCYSLLSTNIFNRLCANIFLTRTFRPVLLLSNDMIYVFEGLRN